MSDRCNRCMKPFSEKDNVITCDCCAESLHEKCTEISPTEARAVIIQKRNLIYFCPSCRDSFKQIPKVVAGLKEALEANAVLREENKKLRMELTESAKIRVDESSMASLVVSEVNERQLRAYNLVVRGVQESGKGSQRERVEEDKAVLEGLLGATGAVFVIKKTFRLGKYSMEKVRPVKVVLAGPEEVVSVLKGRKKIQIPGIIIHRDETKMQRDYYYDVKKKLEECVSRGENKIIGYVRGVPTIKDGPAEPKN